MNLIQSIGKHFPRLEAFFRMLHILCHGTSFTIERIVRLRGKDESESIRIEQEFHEMRIEAAGRLGISQYDFIVGHERPIPMMQIVTGKWYGNTRAISTSCLLPATGTFRVYKRLTRPIGSDTRKRRLVLEIKVQGLFS